MLSSGMAFFTSCGQPKNTVKTPLKIPLKYGSINNCKLIASFNLLNPPIPMPSEYSAVITTVSSKEDASKLAKVLLEQQLAACIQVFPITSYYTWKNEIANEEELLLLIKIKSDDYNDAEKLIKANHKYEIPEIIKLPVEAGFEGYLNWVKEVTR